MVRRQAMLQGRQCAGEQFARMSVLASRLRIARLIE